MAAACRVAFLVALTFACTPLVALADDFADFRVPTHHALSLLGSASGSTSWYSSTSERTGSDRGSSEAYVNGRLEDSRESEHRVQSLLFVVTGTGTRQHNFSRSRSTRNTYSSEDLFEQYASGGPSLSVSEQWYPAATSSFLTLEGVVDLVGGRHWAGEHVEVLYDPLLTTGYDASYRNAMTTDDWDTQSRLRVSAAIGFGRVRDATPYFEACVFAGRLLASGVLVRPLSHAGLEALASLFYRRGDFKTTHDRPAAPLWTELQRILDRDGALGEHVWTADALFGAIEPFLGGQRLIASDGLPTSNARRRCGWSSSLLVEATTFNEVIRHRNGVTDVPLANGIPYRSAVEWRATHSSDFVSCGVDEEFHQPMGMKWQFDASSRALLPVTSKRSGVDERTSLAITHIVTDRWLVNAGLLHVRVVDKGASGYTGRDMWRLTESATCSYWLSDRVNCYVTLEENSGHSRSDSNGAGMFRDSYGSAALGMNYRFAGWASAPGALGAIP